MLTHWNTYRTQLPYLRALIVGSRMTDAYTQEKDELVLRVATRIEDLALHISTRPHLMAILPRRGSARARKNTVSFFPGAMDQEILQLDLAHTERCFRITLTNEAMLYIAFSSTRSTVIWIRGNERERFTEVDLPYDPMLLEYGDDLPEDRTITANMLAPPWYVNTDTGDLHLEGPASGGSWQVFEDLHEALALCLRILIWQRPMRDARARMLHSLHREIERLQRKLDGMPSREQQEHRAEEWERWGHTLMIHLEAHPNEQGVVHLPDLLWDPRLVVSIPIRPGEGALQAAQRYYEKAKQIRATHAHLEKLRNRTFVRLEEGRALLLALDAACTMQDVNIIHQRWTAFMPSHATTSQDGDRLPFRRFVVDGDLEVWVGKNSDNNDLLTTRYARPADLWFHARGVGGSHVVLRVHKGTIPTKTAILQTAAIAAYYSKYRKAGTVPVAYTERKYVRKPKNVKSGTVIMDREKVVLVTPALPSPEEEED